MTDKVTYVYMIIDASGSMDPFRADTIGGYNSYLKTLADDSANQYLVTTALFSDQDFYHLHCENLAPDNRDATLDTDSYITKGFTALYDAVGKTIMTAMGRSLGEHIDTLFVILTDGEENNSHIWNNAGLKTLINALESTGRYKFIYLSQGFDGWKQAAGIGIKYDSYVGTQVVTGETVTGNYTAAGKFTTRRASGVRGQSVYQVQEEDLPPGLLLPDHNDI